MTLGIVATRTGDRITIVLAGEADLTTAGELRNALFAAVNERPREIVVDLRDLVFIDSVSIGILIAARRAALEHRCVFVVTNPQGRVFRVFEIAGVLSVLTDPDGSQAPPAEQAG